MKRISRKALLTAVCVTCCALTIGATAPPKRARAIVYPEWQLVLGGTVNGQWREYYHVGPLLRGGERYRLYTLAKCLGAAVGSKPSVKEGEGRDGDYELDLTPLPKTKDDVIAIGGEWNALPRVPKIDPTDQRAYRDVVASFLRAKGIRKPEVRITQVLRVDLEGDGAEEVLISATRVGPNEIYFPPKVGAYSTVIVRKLVRGRARTVELEGSYGIAPPAEDAWPSTEIVKVGFVLDLNGDGVMEVLVHYEYYEGEGFAAYAVQGVKAKELFRQGIGQ